MAFDIDSWYNEIRSGNVIVYHRGSISAELITGTLKSAEQYLLEHEENRRARKKVYNVLVEALQNLYHHAMDISENRKTGENKNYALFALSKPDRYVFTCGNYVLPKHVDILSERIDKINSLDTLELKAMYQSILNNNQYSDKGGGGLGFVDMARRAGCRYVYAFHKMEDDVYFFALDIILAEFA